MTHPALFPDAGGRRRQIAFESRLVHLVGRLGTAGLTGLAGLVATSAALAGPGPLDQGARQCQGVGLTYEATTAPFAGLAGKALANPRFAAAHKKATAGEEPWIAELSGTSAPNRMVDVRRKSLVLVLAVCPASDCASERAYIAFDPRTGAYGATVVEGRNLREIVPGSEGTSLAEHPEAIALALHCGREFDN